ncbi:DUF1996 domain-containing protein [Streptomyces rochei]|uniref:DUF1996 domain-containing protein n=1 Tax=Streptomyces TaxID=1883 RepID=UPI00031AE168|nr:MULTISPECIES: DUF1996 domain-containing protein [Streptomyces]MBX4174251.1 DUF1996 domain-containing protein [Streptomyces geysiriensis]NUV97767.1 DUF1996 domain-containing protein [Streptomyces sp. KAI 90]PVD10753.1 DUF1996 domain-containing protein [Streptomyces sp. CS207]RSS11513.1 DUF1996 domain-containing protein [Streptomyces sp. WAC08401]
MGRNTRKRRTPLATKVVAGAAALAVGGGGLVWANFYASAHEEGPSHHRTRSAAAQVATIDCPDVGQQLSGVPDRARGEVDGELATMDSQITEAYQRLATTRRAQAGDPRFVQNTILGPLKDRRKAIIDRIQLEINRAGGQADEDLDRLAGCQGQPAEQPQAGDGQDGGGQDGDGQNGDGQDQDGGQNQDDNGNGAAGPVADDFIDIDDVEPNSRASRNGLAADGDGGSTGTFTTDCGVNENDLFNSDNLIAAPGVDNGAHHVHDYVGNQDNDAFSSDEDLANADTSCRNQGDRSTYYWPVLRLQDGTEEFDANDQGGGAEGNVGRILKPARAELKFVGNQQGDVVAMPKFLRIITGDAKSFTNGDANANSSWSCTGFEDRQVTDKYPLCPEGSQVVRTANFQSCWDGQNIDSANHRDHMAFVQEDGGCPNGFQAVPQLQVRLVYDIPTPVVENGQVRNPYAVDSFPEQLHKPITDHNDFINVMDEDLMDEVVRCINSGEDCQ